MRMPPLSGKTPIASLFALCAVLALPAKAGTGSPGVAFWTVTPCRLLDTRSGPPLGPGVHTFPVSGLCGIPAGTVAVSLSGVTVVTPPMAGSLTVYQSGIPFPGTSVLNWNANQTRASHTIAGLSASGAVDVFISLASPGGVHVLLDTGGYFADTPPTAVDDNATVTEDDPATAIPVLANDTDPDGGPMVITAASDPAGGTVVLTGGSPGAHTGLTYQPDPNFCNTVPPAPPDTFTYTLNGGSTATVSVTVTCVDDPPAAVDDAATVAEDDPATAVPVLTNDTDPESDPFTIASASDPANGTVVLTGGSPGAHTGLTYQPDPNYCNSQVGGTPDTFTYSLNPGGSTATVSMTVTCVDDNPVAVDDTATVAEDAAATPIPVLANDTDVDAGPMSIASASDPANGTVVLTGGSPGAHTGLTYQPDPNFCSATADTFTYSLNPGGSTATVSVTVTCGDDNPIAVNDSATVSEDDPATAILVLANDTDIDGGPMFIASASDPANGTVVLTGGSPGAHTGLTYQPDPNYCNNPPGSPLDTFTYSLNPGGSTATVSVTVTCTNDGPLVDLNGGQAGFNFAITFTEGDAAKLIEDGVDPDAATIVDVDSTTLTTLTVTLTNLLDPTFETLDANLTGFPNITKTYDTTTTPGTGVLTLTGTGPQPVGDFQSVLRTVTYVNTDQAPDATLRVVQFVGNDGTNTGNTPQTDITVVAVEDDPVAVADSATVAEDAAATPIPVLANDTDADGGPMTISSATDPANGTVVLTGGSPGAHTGLTYQPDPNYCNSVSGPADTFNYTLNGGSSAQVSMTVTCVDDNPVAVADAATVTEDDPATAIPVLANDTDSDGGPMTISSATDPANGTVVLTGGSPGAHTGLTYQPDPNYCNSVSGPPDTFNYTLNGGSSAQVSMTVTCVDDNPVAVADSATVTEDDPATSIPVLTNDTDVDGGPKTISSATDPANGTVVLTGGSPGAHTGLTYQPDPNYCNSVTGIPDTFNYTLNGGSSAVVSVTVTCVDDPPVAVDDLVTVNEDSGANTLNVQGNDTDIDAGPKAVLTVSDPPNGTATVVAGNAVYTPDLNYCNAITAPSATPDTFTYTLTPGGDTGLVSVTVICINDPPTVVNETFQVIGNTELRVDMVAGTTIHTSETTAGASATEGVLDNDSDPEGDTITVTAVGSGCGDATAPFDCTLASGAVVHVDANGEFSFTPGPGDTTDSFQYTVTDQPPGGGAIPVNGTVTFTFFEMVWYVDNALGAAGNGTSLAPFNSITTTNLSDTDTDGAGADGFEDDVDDASDYIFVDFGDGTDVDQNTGLVLEVSQHLLGEFAGLSIPVNLNGNGSPTVLVAPPTATACSGGPCRPLLSNTAGNGVTASDDNGAALPAIGTIPVEIVGMSLEGSVNAIDLTTTAALTGSSTLTILQNVFRGAGVEGIDVNMDAGTTGTLTLNVQTNSWNTAGTHTGNAVDISRTAGTLRLDFSSNANLISTANAVNINGGAAASTTITNFANNSVHQNTGGSGMLVSNVTFDTVAGSPYTTVSGGNTPIGAAGAGNGVGAAGMVLSGVAGDLAFTDLDVFADGGTALSVTGTGAVDTATGTGTRVTVGAGLAILEATGGPALSLNNLTGDFQVPTLSSTNSSTTGVSLVDFLDGTTTSVFSAGSGSTITNATSTDFKMGDGSASSGGNATVSFDGTITDDQGVLVAIDNATGDTITFSGAITDGDDGDGGGVSLASNTGASITFRGGLVLDTGASNAFSATGGGTISICDESPCNNAATGSLINKIETTTGTGLNVNATTIGANRLEFRSISSIGAGANGIVLIGTGTLGGLTVNGDGSNTAQGGNASGGTISGKVGADLATSGSGIYLDNTSSLVLRRMTINGTNQNFGIRGFRVNNLTMEYMTVNGTQGNCAACDNYGEGAVMFGDDASVTTNGVTGVATVKKCVFGGGFQRNFSVVNTAGSLNRLTITGTDFGTVSTAAGNQALAIEARNSGTVANVTVDGSTADGANTFTGAPGGLVNFTGQTATTMDVVFNDNAISNDHPGDIIGSTNTWATQGVMTFNIFDNTITGMHGSSVTFQKASAGTSLSGTFNNNIIGTTGVAGSGSASGNGIFFSFAGGGTIDLNITNNQIRRYNGNGAIFADNTGGTYDVRLNVTGNLATEAGPTSAGGFLMASGAPSSADDIDVCVQLGGAGALANNFSAGEPSGLGADILLGVSTAASSMRIVGYNDATPTAAEIQTYVLSQNPSAGTIVQAYVDAPATFSTANWPQQPGTCGPFPY